ncbi:hypothetical protein EV174_003735 [Coemansia sp. RSA 2320]|nr:hypothetical protein EV174_003735 [Coemansia sp. RSA 2320]
MLPEDTENCTGAGLPAERNVCAQSAIRLCRRLKDLTSVDEFSSVAMSSLQVLGNIMGMRSHLVARDIAHLRLPHLYVREHIPRSIASLTQLTVQIGLGQLMLEPRLLVHFTSRVRDGSILQSPAMLRAMQMWLDIIGFVLRYSSLRTHSGVFVTASNASAISSKSIPGQLTFPDWWPLALAASAQCLNDAVAAPNDSALDISKLRLACIMPSHILSWYMHLPLSLDASSPALAKLLQPALESDNGRHGGLTNENIGAVNDNYALQQLHACLASFPQPNPPSQSASVVHPVYLLACRLWLNVKLFEQPLKATRDTHSQQLVLQICRDIWGISSDALHLLSRMVLTQPTMRGAFVALGLVGDFSRDVLVRLVSNQGYPGLLSRVLQARQNQLDIESARRLSLGNISDLVTIPQVEMRNEKNELEYRSDSDSDLGLPQPSSTTDVVDKLLADFAHASDCTKRRPTTEYYSMPMLGRLWIELIERLLKFPTSALFVRPVAASEPRSSSLSTTPAARALAGSHGELSEWLDDPGNILYATLTPLLAVRESLVLPSSFWTAMSDTIPVSDVIRTINTNARHEGGKASLRMCVSAAFLLPEFTAAPDLLRSEMEAVAAALFDSLVHGLLLLPAENDDESRHEQCLMALLFLAWRQRRCISEQVALCATQLRREVVAMGEDLASGQPCLSAIQEHLTTHSSIDDVYAGDVVWLSGKASSGCDREPVATSPTLLVSHSPVLKAMLTGEFAEAQAIASSKARQVSLQCDHATLARMLDILHRYATMGSAVAEGTAAEERLRVALERDFTPDQLAEVFELAVYYNLRPVVIFLAWKLAAGFGVESLAAVSSDPASLSRLARLLGGGWLVHRMPDSAAQAIQQTLTAVLLLRLDEIDSISVPEDATFSFASAALSLMKRTQ